MWLLSLSAFLQVHPHCSACQDFLPFTAEKHSVVRVCQFAIHQWWPDWVARWWTLVCCLFLNTCFQFVGVLPAFFGRKLQMPLPSWVCAPGAVTSPTLLILSLEERRQGAESCQITGWGKPALQEKSRKEKLMVETRQAKLFSRCHSTFLPRGRTPPCPAPAQQKMEWRACNSNNPQLLIF